MFTARQAKEVYWAVSNPTFDNPNLTLSRWEADGIEQSRNTLYHGLRKVKDNNTLSFTFFDGKTEKTITLDDLIKSKAIFSDKDNRFIDPHFASLPNKIRIACDNDNYDIDAKTPIRLERITEGAKVDLIEFASCNCIFKDAVFSHWEVDGNKVSPPTRLKDTPQNILQIFNIDNDKNKAIKLIKDPDGFGAMFLQMKIGTGKDTRTKLKRITAYS